MSYCTYDDLVNAFGKEEILLLTDRDRNGRQDEDVLEEAIAFADAYIDGYLRERYSVCLLYTSFVTGNEIHYSFAPS